MGKRVLLKRRAPVATCVELLVPVVFALGIAGIYYASMEFLAEKFMTFDMPV
jgi:hypothetical protein